MSNDYDNMNTCNDASWFYHFFINKVPSNRCMNLKKKDIFILQKQFFKLYLGPCILWQYINNILCLRNIIPERNCTHNHFYVTPASNWKYRKTMGCILQILLHHPIFWTFFQRPNWWITKFAMVWKRKFFQIEELCKYIISYRKKSQYLINTL